MKTDSTDAAWAAARAAEPDSMSRDQIATLLADVRRARSWLDAVEMRAARRIRALEAIGQAEPADSMIANASGCTSRDARTVTDRDTVCDALPDVEDAFSEGSITAAHVDAIAAASKSLPEPVRDEFNALSDDLLRRSAQVTLDSFGRRVPRAGQAAAGTITAGRRRRRTGRPAGRIERQAMGRPGDRNAPHPPRAGSAARCEAALGHATRARTPPRRRLVAGPQLGATQGRRFRQHHCGHHHPGVGSGVGPASVRRRIRCRASENPLREPVPARRSRDPPRRVDSTTQRLWSTGSRRSRCSSATTGFAARSTPGSVKPTTEPPSRSPRCAGCAATPRCSRWCSAATARCSMRADHAARPAAASAERCEPCTTAAPTPTAPSDSTPAASTTSTGGGSTTDQPTSTTSCRCANATTTTSTKAAGHSP